MNTCLKTGLEVKIEDEYYCADMHIIDGLIKLVVTNLGESENRFTPIDSYECKLEALGEAEKADMRGDYTDLFYKPINIILNESLSDFLIDWTPEIDQSIFRGWNV